MGRLSLNQFLKFLMTEYSWTIKVKGWLTYPSLYPLHPPARSEIEPRSLPHKYDTHLCDCGAVLNPPVHRGIIGASPITPAASAAGRGPEELAR